MENLYDFVMKKLSETKRKWIDVSKFSGVPISTVRKIAQGHTKNPSVHHVQALANFFKSCPETFFTHNIEATNEQQPFQDVKVDERKVPIPHRDQPRQ